MIKDLNDFECPYCDSKDGVVPIEEEFEQEYKGVNVKFKQKGFYCSRCKEKFQTGGQLDGNLLLIKDVYRKKVGLLTSSEIASIRKKFKLSQADFSLMLGLGEVTITRYESKSIQDSTYDMLIRNVSQDNLFALELLEKNKSSFSKEKYNKIKSTIEEFIAEDGKSFHIKKAIESIYVKYEKPSRENGYRALNVDTLNNILGILVKKAKGFSSKVKLMKELWYIDYLSFLRTGKSATGLVYTHMPMGALAEGHDQIMYLPALNTTQGFTAVGNIFYKIDVADDFKAKKVSAELNEIIDEVVKKFADYNAKDIIDYMHHEDAYLFTKENEIIPFVEEYKIKNF